MTPGATPTPAHHTPVRHAQAAIVGMACRLPAAANLDEFRRARDRSALAEPVGDPRLDAVDLFDSAWFGLSEAESAVADPRERLALEAVVEAIDDAGVGYRMRGSGAAVLVTLGPSPGIGYS
uniref:beta-ketoacyl synthase N-terminal-like domain-containing protein n=3 Tax=Nocardia TaxID=1817 RepID=UPI00245794FA